MSDVIQLLPDSVANQIAADPCARRRPPRLRYRSFSNLCKTTLQNAKKCAIISLNKGVEHEKNKVRN